MIQGWKHSASDGVFEDGRGPMTSSRHVYHLKPSAPTLAFITVIQPKKRANTRSKYWYCDPCLIILKRSAAEGEWACEACVLTGIRRQTTVEIFIDPKYTYCCIPFSCLASTRRNKAFSFRLTSYSLEEILIERQGGSDEIRDASVRLLQKEILSRERKMLLPVAERGLLACIHGECSLVLMAVNGSHDSFLSLKLTVDLQDGTIVLLGCPDASHDIPPRSQRVLAVVANDGRLSTTTKVSFRYMSSTVPVRIKTSGCMRNGLELDKNVEVSMSGEFLTSHIPPSDVQERGCESIDTYMWIPQLGASATT